MNGFDFKPAGNPFQMLTPELLAHAASAAFRPPPPMMMPGLNLQPSLSPMPHPTPGLSFRDGVMLANEALKDVGKRKNGGVIMNAGPQGSGQASRVGGAYTLADAMRVAGLKDFLTNLPFGGGV